MFTVRQAELVGKRFLCVRVKNALRPNSRSSRVSNPLDYQWKVGVIRACSEKDLHHPELKVLVEYDNEEWTSREWLKIHDGSWKLFLVEQTMVWSQRPDPSNPRRPLLWPALTFAPLVDKHGLKDEERPIPVEFVGDHERAFVRSDEFRPYGQDDDALQPVLRNNSVVMNELRTWQRLQKSQSILMEGPFTLTGFRVQVYRQTCRQWFSAVITAHDILSRELSVMDDTVLQTHRVNPRLIQVILLANEAELDSLLRGELNVVRVLPMRQHRHSQVIITAPLATQTTSSSLPSVAPSTWQLYAGLTQATESNNLANCTQSAYQSPAASTSTRLSTATSPVTSQGASATKERRKSNESRNQNSASRRSTRSVSASSPPSSTDTQQTLQQSPQQMPQQTQQTPQSTFTSSSATPRMSSPRTVTQAPIQNSTKTSPPEAHASPTKSSSSSSAVASPSSLPKASPVKQPMSPKTSPTVLSYNSSPVPNAGMSAIRSPFRANPFCSSPDLSAVASMASPIAAMSHMGMRSPGRVGHSRAQSPHPLYSHAMGRLNLSPTQLYALQLQQQQQQQQMQQPENQDYLSKLRHQHYQSLLHQYQMHCYQLQLMVQQQELIQQMPLTAEQQHILAEHYNQLLYQYQCAQIFQQLAAVTQEEQLSMFHPIDEGDIRSLPERIQQQLREDQERQKVELQNLMPRLEPEQLQTFFTCLQQQNMTIKEIEQLYTALLQQQEAQRGPTQTQREVVEDEQQEQKLQQYLRQNQEQLQKFLQLPKSPSFVPDDKTKEEPNKEAACSSSSPEKPSSPTPSLSPSPNSSFIVHHLPTSTATASTSKAVAEDKPESDPGPGSSTSENPRQPSQGVAEIDLASTAAEGQSIIEKLLQHHKKAIEESRQEASAKARKSKTPSDEKRSRRQRKSTETNTSILNKSDSTEKKDAKKSKTTPSVPVASTDDSSSTISPSLTVRVENCLNSSMKQSPSDDKTTTVVNNKLPRNLGVVDFAIAKDKHQDKAGTDLAASLKDSDKTPLKELEKADASVKEVKVDKIALKGPSGNETKEANFKGAAPWIPEEMTNNVSEAPCLSAKAADSSEMSKDSQDSEKDKTSVLTKMSSEKESAKDITTQGLKNTVVQVAENVSSRAQGKEVKGITHMSPKNTVQVAEKMSLAAPAKEVKGMTTQSPKNTDILDSENMSSKAPVKEVHDMATNVLRALLLKEAPSVPNSKLSNKRTEWLPLTSVRDAKKASAIPSKEVSKTSPVNFSKNSITNSASLSVNDKSEKSDSVVVASEPMEVDTPTVLQKPPSSSAVTHAVTTNCFSNSTDLNGEVFAEGLKTYSKRGTPNKRKSLSRENSVEDSSTVSKVLKVDNKESSEVDQVKNMIHKNNSKAELARRLNKKLANSQSNLQPEEQTLSKLLQNSVTPPERSKASRKKSTDENKVQSSKKAKCEENKSDDVSTVVVQHRPVTRLELKVNTATKPVDENVVDSVSFVADQVVEEVSINHSPTVKDMPGDQFAVAEAKNQRLNSRSKERIREMTMKKKELKAKEEEKRERKRARAEGLSAVTKKGSEPAESLENVVDSVLDEEIPVIYNGEAEEKTANGIKSEQKSTPKEEKATKKTPIKRESTPTNRRGRPRKKEKKKSESDSDAISPTSEQFFLQDRVCANLPGLPKCRDCRDHVGQKTGLECCRFNSFRRLKKKKNGSILAAGFQLPEHAATEDFVPWVAQEKVERMDKKTSLYILFNVGDQFCSVMQEEKHAVVLAETDGKPVSVAYKRAVQGVREMCDVCATTIFNMHWVCHRCGFGVCLDCYNLRVQERERQSGVGSKRVFEFKWMMCGPGICHQPKYLSVAQIIPKTVLSDLGDELHRAREVWRISKTCPCKSGHGNENNGKSGAKITELSENKTNGITASEEGASNITVKSETPSIASSSSNQAGGTVDSESSFEDDVNLICDEKLGLESPADREQEWLTEEKRRNHFTKKAGFGLVEAKPQKDKKVSSGLSLLMDYNSSTDNSPCESPAKDVKPSSGMFNFSLGGGNSGGLCGLDLLVLACERNGEYLNSIGLNSESMKEAERPKTAPQSKQSDKEIKNVSPPVATVSESTSAECSDEVRQHALSPTSDLSSSDAFIDVPHSWLCDGRLLRLHDPRAPGNVKAFEARWKKGEPVLVSQMDKYLNLDLWSPKSFGEEFGDEISDVVNCRNGVVVERFKVGDFWKGFESIKDRPLDNNGEPMLLKLKDWPPKDDFSEKLPTRFEDLMNNVPLPEYTRRDGSRNLVSRLPDFFVKPDLGPKMYNAYGSAACPKEGTTNLHLDMSDAVNVMVYVGVPKDEGAGEKEREDAIKAVDEACDESQQIRVRKETARIGALWHIYAAEDADKIRNCLREVAKERKMKYSAHHDPIHDQCFYLDHDIRQRLKKDYGVEGWAICQCLGDSVFIPAGAPHQVRNLYSCVKVAEDFVSPERIDHCFKMTQEFRHLSDKHTNHEDKLQVKNIIYHAVKDALDSLKHYENEDQTKTDAVH